MRTSDVHNTCSDPSIDRRFRSIASAATSPATGTSFLELFFVIIARLAASSVAHAIQPQPISPKPSSEPNFELNHPTTDAGGSP